MPDHYLDPAWLAAEPIRLGGEITAVVPSTDLHLPDSGRRLADLLRNRVAVFEMG